MSMAYEKQTWVDRVTPLDAEHMNHIEDGIAALVGIESIAQTTTSTSDGGTNVITATLSNGTTAKFNIKNGSKGSTGGKGDTGATGAAGVGIKTVTQTTTSNADGGSNVITVTKTDGTTSTFTVKNGSKGGKGDTGANGYTPVKFVDYYTPADQESIVQQVIAALGTPVFGTIDKNNHIKLSGSFVDGSYTFAIEDKDGKSYYSGAFSKLSYVNQIPISTDTDGSIYNGKGYKEATRGNSSGAPADCTGGSNPPFFTGFIPCKQGDVIRLKNCFMPGAGTNAEDSAFTPIYGTGMWGIRNGLYNSSKGNIAVFSWGSLYDEDMASISDYTAVGTKVKQFTIAKANTAFIRLTLAVESGYTPADAVLTVNQEIT